MILFEEKQSNLKNLNACNELFFKCKYVPNIAQDIIILKIIPCLN